MASELEFENLNKHLTFEEFYLEVYKPSLLANIKMYTIGLPGVVREWLKTPPINKNSISLDSIPRITAEDRKLIEILSSQTSIDINDKDGYVTITGKMPDPLAAANLTNNAKRILQNAIISFHIEKAENQLEYLEKRLEEKKNEFDNAQLNLANYKDQNLYTSTARSSTELEKLQSKYDLAFGIYSELAQQVEGQRLQVKQDTPVFTVIQPAVVPDQKVGMGKLGVLFIFIFIGFIFSSISVLGKAYIQNLKDQRILSKMSDESKIINEAVKS